MKGTRPLTPDEIREVSRQFTGFYEVRNRALFIIGCNTGGRISELLALNIDDVWQNDKPVTDLLFERSIVKGGEVSRAIPVNEDCRQAITELVGWHIEQYGDLEPRRPLFISRKHRDSNYKALSRTQAHRILCKAFERAGLNGKLATHSMRKTFAQGIYDSTGDLVLCQELLGHQDISTTRQYLSVSYEKAKKAVESIELNKRHILLHSVSELSDNDLIVELATRGFDMSNVFDQLRAKREKSQVSETHIRQKAKVIPLKSKDKDKRTLEEKTDPAIFWRCNEIERQRNQTTLYRVKSARS